MARSSAESADEVLNDSRGAVWRRWEPHIHTPGTALSDRYANASLDDFLLKVEAAIPPIQALAVTDYLLTRRYKDVHAAKQAGRLPGVRLLLCNVEMRLSIETKAGKGVNLHLLVSTDAPNAIDELERFLSRLTFHYSRDDIACTESDLRRLGRMHDPSTLDDEAALKTGVNQFKVDFQQLRKLYDDTQWAQNNMLIAVAGSSNDGTAGLQDESASFAAIRKEIEQFAHIIFTATPKNIAFWRGDGVLSEEALDLKYRGAKPCLHGSDAHRLQDVANPADNRYTWIKGDPTFDALRQACLEPRSRVSIGAAPPTSDTPYAITTVATPSLRWLLPDVLPVNPGMVAIIGARGSGKTALADLIAHAGDSPYPTNSSQSFLTRARSHLSTATVNASWTDSSHSSRLLTDEPVGIPDVHYLTQQFVDRLCSSVAESDELLDEIKRVVFLAQDPASRLGADDFDSLARFRSSETELALEALNQRLDRLSNDILVERSWYLKGAGLTRDLAKANVELEKVETARRSLIRPGGQNRSEYYTRLSEAINEREHEVQQLARQMQAYRNLRAEALRYKADVLPQHLEDLQRVYAEVSLTVDEWKVFTPVFMGDPITILDAKIVGQDKLIESVRARTNQNPSIGTTPEELRKCSLTLLKAEFATIGEAIGVDRKNVQRLEQLNKLHAAHSASVSRLSRELKRVEESPERLQRAIKERADLYGRYFDLIIEQSSILTELYGPLEERLRNARGSAGKLTLRVVRQVDVDRWATEGETLLDLRKNGKLRGKGALFAAAREALMPAWTTGSAKEVAEAMEGFRKNYDQSLVEQASVDAGTDEFQRWVIELGRWLYSTSHIKVHYSIEYEGTAITQLSPGTRGIVLLLLYLALDVEDARPLIIDQPEENLDPKSVYSELVDLFREARLRRQVIIVTHNANLVVNTDVDQVIVASCIKREPGTPPEFHYQSGGLEDSSIRAQVCDILEGGETAFKERAKRLRIRIGGS